MNFNYFNPFPWLKGCIVKAKKEESKTCALVHKNGKTFIRNYGHPLKNGQGMTEREAERALSGAEETEGLSMP